MPGNLHNGVLNPSADVATTILIARLSIVTIVFLVSGQKQ